MEKIKITFSPKEKQKGKGKVSQMFCIPDERAEIMVEQIAEIAKKAMDAPESIITEQVVNDICELAENPQEAAFCGFTASKVIEKLEEWSNSPLAHLLSLLHATCKDEVAEPAPQQPSTEQNG